VDKEDKKNIMNILSFNELNTDNKGRNRLLPIIDTLRRMGGRSGEFVLKLGTADDARESFKKFKEYASFSPLGEDRILRILRVLNVFTGADFKELLLDQDYGRLFLTEVPGMHIKLTGGNSGKRGRVAGRPTEKTIRSMSDVYNLFGYTWDEEEALDAVKYDEDLVWVVRTNEYPKLPALFIYPKDASETEEDEAELISKYEHRLATLYKYELRDPAVNAYWLARPCKYTRFLDHPIPDGSELIKETNENNTMNTLTKDRNTLKRLVESYGKKDVLNFVRHLNESINITQNDLEAFKNGCYCGVDLASTYTGGPSIAFNLDEWCPDGNISIDDLHVEGNTLVLDIDYGNFGAEEYDSDIDDCKRGWGKGTLILKRVDSTSREQIMNVLDSVSKIVVNVYFPEHDETVQIPCAFYALSEISTLDSDELSTIDINLQRFAISKFGKFEH